MNLIKAIIEYGDYSFEMNFANLNEFDGACKLAKKLREEDYVDVYVNKVDLKQQEIDNIDAKIAELKELRNQLINS